MTTLTPPEHGFPKSEFEMRFSRAQGVMDAHELDALLLTTPPNVRYFTGFDTQFWESPTRPWFLILPRDGQPHAIVPEIGEGGMRGTWIEDIRTWPAPQPEDDGVFLLTAALSSLKSKYGRIGAEMGRESVVRMPLVDFDKVREDLGNMGIVDGSPAIWDLRRIKSPAEIERIRYICQLTSEGFEALTGKLRIGDSEREAVRKLRLDLTERGCDSIPFMPGVSGPGGYSQVIIGPGDKRLESGDVLFIDTGAMYDGYFCDFDRNFGFGQVDDIALRAHESIWDATEAGFQSARPGATTSDVWRAMSGVLENAGSKGNNVGRLGHGLGLQLTEPPSNTPDDATLLSPGLVLTLEPGMEYAPGKMQVHEENIVITEDGAEWLTKRGPRELPIVRN